MLGVKEFAGVKGVTPERIYALVREGRLPHRRIGNAILLEDAALQWMPKAARALSSRLAAALMSSLDGRELPSLASVERGRLRAYVDKLRCAERPESLLSSYLSNRAELRLFSVQPRDLSDMRVDERVTLAGVSTDRSGIGAPGIVECYIDGSTVEYVVRDYLLQPATAGEENVRLRFGLMVPVGDSAIAADLADWGRPRESREARRILGELLDGLR